MQDKTVALVTGANRGLGFEISRQLGQKGMAVLIGSRNPENGGKAAEMLRGEGLDVRALTLDVSDGVSIKSAVEIIESYFGR